LLYLGDICQFRSDHIQAITPNIRMCDLTTFELHTHTNFHTTFYPTTSTLYLDAKMMFICLGAKLKFFDLNVFLLLACLTFAPLLFVLKLAEVHNLTYGRVCVRRNLYQIKIAFFCHVKRATDWYYTDIVGFSVLIFNDEANFAGAYLPIYSMVSARYD